MRLCCAFLIIALTFESKSFADGYTVCGNPTYKSKEVNEAVDEIVKRFMALRSPDWGWESMSTVTTIQVAAPKKLFARNKVVTLIRSIIRYNWDYLDILGLSELSFAARSLCMNPRRIRGRDLLENIHDKMFEFFANTSKVENENVIEYTLALSSLCINRYPFDENLVEKLLEVQNDDGSFGNKDDATELTIFMVRPIYCLTQMENASFSVSKVRGALKRMRVFTKKYVKQTENGAYIGQDEITSSDALIGMYKSIEPGDDPNKDWRCREVMDTLGLDPKPDEDEYDLQERLLRITGTDYLDMLSKDYSCIKNTDPIPSGYKPTCTYEKPETCGIDEDAPK